MSILKQFWYHPKVQRAIYFFPFQLFLLHIKRNHVLILVWLMLAAFVTGEVGREYGVMYLFLDPEYMGRVDFWSFLLLGFAMGGFIMAFHIASYTLNATKFPFLATLSRPLFKYSFNNSLIPTLFVGFYLYCIIDFQLNNELVVVDKMSDVTDLLTHQVAGFIGGILLFMVPGYLYFIALSRDIFRVFGITDSGGIINTRGRTTIRKLLQSNLKWRELRNNPENDHQWKVITYLASPYRVALARETDHYEPEMLRKVFQQNQLIAAVFELGVLISFLLVGAYRETPELSIPAGAVLLLTLTAILMTASAIHSLLRGWTAIAFIVGAVLVQYLVANDVLHYQNQAYGMNYDGPRAIYHLDSLKQFDQNIGLYEQDVMHHYGILNRWKAKNTNQRRGKPKMVVICVTGGGVRSSMWAFRAMQVADSLSGGELMQHTHLITGASGGMLGMAYLRELYLRAQTDTSIHLYDERYADRTGADVLNPIGVSSAVNDWFIRFQRFRDGQYIYTKDRGYALERQLILNSDSIYDKRLRDYQLPESEARIPLMFLTPSIINDGRTLYISSQPVSHLTFNNPNSFKGQPLQTGVEFTRFFKDQDADNLWFTTALRMNASFPYICPSVTLPSSPEIEVMDAGFRDSYGPITALKHLYAMRTWIEKNTSGVVLIQIRDMPKLSPVGPNPPRSLMNMLMNPLGHIYSNLFSMQDYNNDDLTRYAHQWLNADLEVIDLELMHSTDGNISMSWHLTSREKRQVKQSAYHPKNRMAMDRIAQLLKE
ncbi:MAG: hypothetical protein K9J06_11640 [Flavobacteriales bacterium]|nr:hypothetical protein [Flavobacteriales bacterium]